MSGIATIESSFLREVSLPVLLEAQNSDGGWGYVAGSKSAMEPTSWGLLAIGGTDGNAACARQEAHAARFLKRAQLADGSWPAVIGQAEGGWVTSIACLALRAYQGDSPETGQALDWLCREWPGDGGLWWRARRRLRGTMRKPSAGERLRGWSWTCGTSSWVEPTAHALLALRGAELPPDARNRAERRRELAKRMLCNRMCAGGGWNCGNAGVYGARAKPLVGPTAWALVALGEFADEREVKECARQGLDWLEAAWSGIRGPGSLALAHISLRAHGRASHPPDAQLSELYEESQFMQQIPVLAWTTLALRPSLDWLGAKVFASA